MSCKLIIAADVSDMRELVDICAELPDEIEWYKVGLELFSCVGPDAVHELKKRGKRVFLDLKLHDIPRTVSRAVAAVSSHGVDMLTVHSSGGRVMLECVRNASGHKAEAYPIVVAVTVLTSMDQNDLKDTGVARDMAEHASALGRLSIESGLDGLVCSPLEVSRLRRELGPAPVLVVPGVRPAGSETNDQKRTATPGLAVKSGASYLVVGRSILESPSPRNAARDILNEIAEARSAANSRGNMKADS